MANDWLARLASDHDQSLRGMQKGMLNWIKQDREDLERFSTILCECDDPEVFRDMDDSEILNLKSLAKLALSDLIIRIGERMRDESSI